MPLTVTEYPPCYLAKSSPEIWDAQFEALFRERATPTTAKGFFDAKVLEERKNFSAGWHQVRLEEYAGLKRALCELQYDVSLEAATFLTSLDLTNKWLSASVSVREKHVLIGIANACAVSPNLNQARLCCAKELRVAYLSNNGEALLDLVDVIAPDDLSEKPSEPRYIHNEEWDHFQSVHQDFKDDVERVTLGTILVLRTKIITHVLQFIICSFLDMELPVVPVLKKSRAQEKKQPLASERLDNKAKLKACGKEKYNEIAAERKTAYQERKANKISECHQCGKMAKTREVFKRCIACGKIGREVLYCSKECQAANWKTEHKFTCGKPLDFETANTLATMIPKSTELPASLFPPPAPGFKRPLELLEQMKTLSEHPTYDYAVHRSVYENGENIGLMTYPHPEAKKMFRLYRERAVTTGHLLSVAFMCEYILWDFEIRGSQDFTREKVIEQLSREYRLTVEDLSNQLKRLDEMRASRPGCRPTICCGPDRHDKILRNLQCDRAMAVMGCYVALDKGQESI
ncbi:hypothetical protein GALMADRAFT_216173 [Galerina marginata CBS 339.88]|uniref:MYND-type domain-containing protein n=1 Tax=Galerina marginata (strain CBS 339.88) TaxID=685588 RepID=A0A067SAA2_GALM3|nr:hypothetical protein GALMADRAFT_216173 [Galerina marginata CBS 339.88]